MAGVPERRGARIARYKGKLEGQQAKMHMLRVGSQEVAPRRVKCLVYSLAEGTWEYCDMILWDEWEFLLSRKKSELKKAVSYGR